MTSFSTAWIFLQVNDRSRDSLLISYLLLPQRCSPVADSTPERVNFIEQTIQNASIDTPPKYLQMDKGTQSKRSLKCAKLLLPGAGSPCQ